MAPPKRFVYILKSETDPRRYYTGDVRSIDAPDHNDGRCAHTASARPWIPMVVIEFIDERRALDFERYLKSGSGVSFSQRHFR